MNIVQMSGITGTSGGGAVARGMSALYAGAICLLFLVGGHPAQATTSTYSIEISADQTDSRLRTPVYVAATQNTGETVLEIRRRSGLTWEELADLFGVSRRSVHNWASGEVLAAKNERHVRLILSAVRQLDRLEPRRTREALLMVDAYGMTALDLLKAGDPAGAIALAGGVRSDETGIVGGRGNAIFRRPRAATYLDAQNAPDAASIGKGKLARIYRSPKA